MTDPGDAAGLFGPGSLAWRLNREATLLLAAGPRALLMQVAHPLIAEGVDQHSDFRTDPWARLRGTLRSYLRIVYGTTGAARREIGRLNALHRQIAGPVRDPAARHRHGPSWTARDPELSLWVHATLVDSTMAANDAWLAPLSPAERGRYYAETLQLGRAFGIPTRLLPPDIEAFDGYVATMLAEGSPVAVSPTARELAACILAPPLGPLWAPLAAVPTQAYAWTLWPAVELLPPRLRREFRLEAGRVRRAVAAWLEAGWKAWRPLLPTSFRAMPQALAADRRIARSPGGRAARRGARRAVRLSRGAGSAV